MCSKQNRRFKCKCVQHSYRNKLIEKLSKAYIIQCKRKFDGRKRNWGQWWKNDKYHCECKKYHICKRDYVWNPTTCNPENGKYLASIADDSTSIYNKVMGSYNE